MRVIDKFFVVFANLVLIATAMIIMGTASGAGDGMLPILFLPMAFGGVLFLPWAFYRACTGWRSCRLSLLIGLCCFVGSFQWLILLGLGLPITVIPVAVAGWLSLKKVEV